MTMKLIPQETYTIYTSISVPEIKEQMMKYVEPKKMFRFFRGGSKYFEGDVSDSGFKLTRIISYRNSFLPIIKGSFEERASGLKVDVSMSMHPFVIAFMLFWFGGVGIGFITMLFSFIKSPTNFHPASLIPAGMLLFGWVLVSVGFWPEARKAKEKLNEILNN